MFKKIFTILALFVFTLNVLPVLAGDETKSLRLNNPKPGNILDVKDDKYFVTASPNTWKTVYGTSYNLSKAIVEFGIDESQKINYSAFSSTVTFNVSYFDKNGIQSNIYTSSGLTPVGVANNQTLAVNYNPASGTSYTGKSLWKMDDQYWIQVKVLSIVTKQGTTVIPNPRELYLDASISTERYYNLNTWSSAQLGNVNNRIITASNEMEIYWPFVIGAEEYELEWCWDENANYDFRNRSTRIVTSENYYRIPLMYETGTISYRIRPIGRTGVDFSLRQEGKWTNEVMGAPESGIVSALNHPSGKFYKLAINEYSGGVINWSANMTFDENGNKGYGVGFMDGLLMQRENIAKLNTEDKIITQTTLYDYQGRPAVSVLPAPLEQQGVLFVPQLNKYYNGSSYVNLEKNIFDIDGTTGCASPVAPQIDMTSAGAGGYYAPTNHTEHADRDKQQKYLPNAEGYPYVRIEYTPDLTGRIRKQTQPGSTHKLGSDKETKYFYANPSQQELDRLFGSEVGYSSHYSKNAVMDANGQLSVNYVDMQGRTIATALAGNKPNQVDALDSYNTTGTSLTDNLILKNKKNYNDYELVVNSSIFVDKDNDLQTINYSFTPADFRDACMESKNLCFDCFYDLELSIKDECGNDLINTSGDPGNPQYGPLVVFIGTPLNETPVINNNCETPAVQYSLPPVVGNITFPKVGTYFITKKLKVSTMPVEDYWNFYSHQQSFLNNTCVKSIWEFLPQAAGEVDFSSCNFTCEQCTTALNAYATQNGISTSSPTYTFLLSECNNNCNNIETYNDPCEAYREQMMADLTPTADWKNLPNDNGQYVVVSYDGLGNPTDVKFGGHNNNLNSYVNYTYYDDDMTTVSSVKDDNGIFRPASSLTPKEFLENFKPSWAKSVLITHPEKCYLDYCESNKASDIYDQNMLACETFDEACSKGFLKPISLTGVSSGCVFSGSNGTCLGTCSSSNLDPFFNGNSTLTTVMQTEFNSYNSYYQYSLPGGINSAISGLQTPPGNSMAQTLPNKCIYDLAFAIGTNGGTPSCYSPATAICVYDKDKVWQAFRSLYLSKKRTIMEVERRTYMIANDCYNGCIGVGNNSNNPTYVSPYVSPDNTSTSIACNSTNYAYYSTKQRVFSDYTSIYLNGPQYNVSTSGGVPSTSSGTSPNYNTPVIVSLPEKYFQNCTAYADEWMKKLKDCSGLVPNSTLWNNIRTDLIAVCAYGSNSVNPLGVSAIASPSPSTNPPFTNPYYTTGGQHVSAVPFVTTGSQFATLYYTPTSSSVKHFNSFQEVLTHYLGSAVNAVCNAELIQFPGPQHTPFSPNGPKPYNILDTCACNAIMQNDAKFLQLQSLGQLPSGVTTAVQLFLKERNISLGNYLELLCACKNTNSAWTTSQPFWNTTTHAQTLKDMNLFVPPGLSCCLLCTPSSNDPWDGALTSFATYYQSLTGNTFNLTSALTSYPWPFPSLFTNYMNNLFGYNVSFDEYITFFENCKCPNPGGAQRVSMPTEVNENAFSLLNYLNTRLSNKTIMSNGNFTYLDDPYFFSSRLYSKNVPATAPITYSSNIIGDSLKIVFTYTDSVTAFNRTIVIHNPDTFNVFESLNSFDDIQLMIDTGYQGDIYKFRLASTGFDANGMPGTVYYYGRVSNLPLNEGNLYGYRENSVRVCGELCNKTEYPIEENDCINTIMNQIVANAQSLHAQYLKQEKEKFIKKYMESCMAVTETFERNYQLHEHHYTLYYYDQAGNLSRTVPPKGVNPLSGATNLNKALASHAEAVGGPNEIFPQHEYVTNYNYNSYNTTFTSVSPDEDKETFYAYDYLGRIIASTNAKQQAAGTAASTFIWSYTIYDKYGRISEVGEVTDPSLNLFYVYGQGMVQSPTNWSTILAGKTKNNITRTYYDQTISTKVNAYFNYNQQNLRNRVSSVTFQEIGTSSNYDYATHFSYDEAGNVKLMIQENTKLENLGQHIKYIEYAYDLFSGNVNTITYQPNEPDKYIHKYIYDKDNRLHEVFTSRDGMNWERDAKYFYYQHGALARTELGEKQVSGIDFAYTIHGWLKGVNSDVLDPSADIGKDAASGTLYSSQQSDLHRNFAKDAMGYSLNYYHNNGTVSPDYQSIYSTSFLSNKGSLFGTGTFNLNTDAPDLYNGNISSMVTTYMNFDPNSTTALQAAAPQLTAYKYDQLHRLTLMKSFRDLVTNSSAPGFNAWNPAASNYDNAYTTQLIYDANGNIVNLYRNGSTTNIHSGSGGVGMDFLTYNYSQHAGSNSNRKTNRLIGVVDGVTNSAYTDDIESQGVAVSNDPTKSTWNYDYDEIGNLIRDNSEQIASIEWTTDRKVKRILRTQNPKMVGSTPTYPAELEFDYDANRQRVLKIVKPRFKNTITNKGETKPQSDWLYTYYVRDAQGQVMAVYEMNYVLVTAGNPATYKQVYKVTEYDIYGSSRIGTDTKSYTITSSNFTANFDANGNFVYVTPATGPQIPKLTSGPIPIYSNLSEYPDVYGNKTYELSNHLGNVIATISDRKTNISTTTISKLINFEGTYPNTTTVQGAVSPTKAQQVDNTTSPFSSSLSFMVTPGAQINASVYAKNNNNGAGFLVIAFVDKVTNAMIGWNTVAFGNLTLSSWTQKNNVQIVPNSNNPIEATVLVHNPSNNAVYIDDLAYTLTAPSGQSYVSQYLPDVQSHNDYYPFGMVMPGRNWVSDAYRYGHNGQEKEDEIAKGINSAEYWMYDSRLGRRWETDPIVKPWESPYATFSENPIFYSDPTGENATPPDKILHDDQTGEVVGYQKDANGTEYVTDVYGHVGEDGGFVLRNEVTPEQKQAVIDNANRRAKQIEYSTNTGRLMDQFEKNLLGISITGPAAVFALESGLAMLAVRTTIGMIIDELAGFSNPVGYFGKQGLKQAEKKVIKELEEEVVEGLDWTIVSKTGETRMAHVAKHGENNLQKEAHGVFFGNPQEVVEKAWAGKGNVTPVLQNGTDVYIIKYQNAGYAGGYSGQGQVLNNVTIITQAGTNKVITAFPSGSGMKVTQ